LFNKQLFLYSDKLKLHSTSKIIYQEYKFTNFEKDNLKYY